MLELIIFIIIIVVILNKNKQKQAKKPSRKEPPVVASPSPKKTSPSKTTASKQEKKKPEPAKEKERTFIQPTRPYRPAHNAGERYEEWMPVPDGKEVCRCGYCGADNLIPRHSNRSQYTCYFCREEL